MYSVRKTSQLPHDIYNQHHCIYIISISAIINENLSNSEGIITREQLKSYLSEKGVKVQNSANIDYMYNSLLKELRIQNKKY